MDQFIEGKNPYEILELKNGQQSTLEEIKKVWHTCALLPCAGPAVGHAGGDTA